MEKRLSLILMLTFILGVLSLGLGTSQVSEGLACESVKDSGNVVGASVPDAAPFTDEIFNVYVSNDTFGSINLTNKTVTGFGCSESSDATYDAHAESKQVLIDIGQSESPLETYNKKRSSGELEIEGTNFGRDLKIKIVNFFSGLFG